MFVCLFVLAGVNASFNTFLGYIRLVSPPNWPYFEYPARTNKLRCKQLDLR